MESERIDPSHPFHKVFEALDLIKWEYNDMLNGTNKERRGHETFQGGGGKGQSSQK